MSTTSERLAATINILNTVLTSNPVSIDIDGVLDEADTLAQAARLIARAHIPNASHLAEVLEQMADLRQLTVKGVDAINKHRAEIKKLVATLEKSAIEDGEI